MLKRTNDVILDHFSFTSTETLENRRRETRLGE